MPAPSRIAARRARRAPRLFAASAFALLAALGLAPTSEAAPPDAAPAAQASPFTLTKSTLANGLQVILDVDKRAPLVTVNLWYHVGSKDEAAGRNGFAHLFEHVMFQGSKHVPEDTYFRFLEKAGASSINGTTNQDRTNYFETVPKNQLELALWLESDRMGFLLDHADQATFKSQREVVKNERRQNYENAAYGLSIAATREELFPKDHPYHLLTIGTPEDLDAASLDDVRAFFRTNYVPNNATLVLSGDVDPAKAMALVEKYFGPIPRGADVPRKTPQPVVRTAESRIEMEAGVELPRVTVSWVTPPFFGAGDAELDLVAHVLSSGKTSRLYKRLVYDLQIAQSVGAGQQSMELASAFEIVATARPGHTTDELLKAIDEELAKLRDGGVKDDELGRAKTSILADTTFDVERGSSRANRLNTYAHYVKDPAFFEKDLARTKGATVATVSDAARKYLVPEARVVTVITPKTGVPLAGRLVRVIKGGAK
jgi:predicted Zn-dependent peptidase